MNQKKKWYNNDLIVALLCIFLFPIGLYALWKNNNIKPTWKVIWTIIIASVVLGNIFDTGETSSFSSSTISKEDSLSVEAKEIFSEFKAQFQKDYAKEVYAWEVKTDSLEKQLKMQINQGSDRGLAFASSIDSIYTSKREAYLSDARKEFERIKGKFTYKKDDFQDIGFYYHKRWGQKWLNRTSLTSYVTSRGFVWFKSNYSESDWIFHTSITVLIDDLKLQSETVSNFDDNNKRDNQGGRVWEVISYGESPIQSAISRNINKKVRVRFNGDQFHKDITLSSGDKQALKDCYELGRLIRLLN